MTRDALTPGPRPIDDDVVASVVRDLAESWVMPPVRLDEPAWRERVRGPRARRIAAARGWLGRFGQAATAAIALTVTAALLAVVLTAPRGNVGRTPAPSTGRTPTPSQRTASSPLPKLLVEGELPTPSRVLVQLDQGDFAIVDLATGTLGSRLTASPFGSQVRRAPNGTLICLCISMDSVANGTYTHASVSLERFDAAGAVTSRAVVLDVTGSPDPRDGQLPEMPGHVAAWTSFSVDGRVAYVGWSARAHPQWRSGVAVVDLTSGTVTQRLALPDRSDGEGDSRTFVDAPRVVGEAGGRVIIGRSWYSWSPAASSNPTYHFSTDAYSATASGGTLGAPDPVALGEDCGNTIDSAGALADGGLWLACTRGGGAVLHLLRRIAADGTLVGDTPVSTPAVDGVTSAISPDGAALYLWDPVSFTLTKVKLADGTVSTGHAAGTATDSGPDPLTALGRWLAPTVEAKTILQAGIAISADGSRVYALGIRGSAGSSETSGSAGVFIFDGATLSSVGHWTPTADFVSIAVSADGTAVYAAGAFGADAAGSLTDQPASITVFNAIDGSVRLIAGQLGRAFITFPATLLP